ncbi:ribokinase [Parasediminibacterium sp. JCM 36343]|uniref:ribokinase n=1 Tax=Parasediminibacterium sp. JCM 36343 TaxID=3374279 RepID=UPI00397B097F
MANKIVVIGSSNTDMVLKTERFPKPGETILGGDFFVFQGGKGANQAVAAARLGGDVSFICKVGNDAFGSEAIQHYAKEGIETEGILQDGQAPTGVAVITVNGQGENCIVVASGANALLSVKDIENADFILENADWLITQLETPLPVVEYLSAYAVGYKKKLILNPAPAAQLPTTVYEGLFLITPNESEAELLTGIEVTNEETAKEAAAIFKARGVQNVIITLGSKGAYVDCEGYEGIVASFQVKAIDTTAAGDVFNGALVVALAEGKGWHDAVVFACKAASVSVTKMGAQTSAPVRDEIETTEVLTR